MKKFVTMLFLGSLMSATSFAEPPLTLADCKNPMKPDSGAVLRGIGLTTGMTMCGLGSISEGAVTSSDISSSSSSDQKQSILRQGVQGSLQIQQASSEAEMSEIYNQDANLQAAFALLANEGFRGSALDFANKVLNETGK